MRSGLACLHADIIFSHYNTDSVNIIFPLCIQVYVNPSKYIIINISSLFAQIGRFNIFPWDETQVLLPSFVSSFVGTKEFVKHNKVSFVLILLQLRRPHTFLRDYQFIGFGSSSYTYTLLCLVFMLLTLTNFQIILGNILEIIMSSIMTKTRDNFAHSLTSVLLED